jgi:ATP-dependent helicase/nuclease subunit A
VLKLPPIARDTVTADDHGDEDGDGWRDSLLTPRVLPEELLLHKECQQAAQWIAERIAAGTAPARFMVLARRRSRLAAIQDALRKLHIPTQQSENNDLNDAPEVQDVVALIDALVSPAHDLSLARALKSPLFNIGDDALVQLALRRRARPGTPWLALLDADDLPAPLGGLASVLHRWQQWLAALPPHDALDAIFHDGDVLARFGAAAPPALRHVVLANLRGLLSASLEIDGARFSTPYGLVRALRAGGVRAPAVAAADAVQLMTVHGAKGLEADNVLVLDSDAAAPRAQTMGVLVEWKGSDPRPTRFVFVASERTPPACAAPLLAEEQRARQREELNGLYVATTRARERLVLSSVQPRNANAGSWWARLEAGCAPIVSPTSGVQQHLATTGAASFMMKTAGAAMPARNVRRRDTTRAANKYAAAFGQAMHRLLEWATPDAALPPAYVRAVAREFTLNTEQAEAAKRVAERIRSGEGSWTWNEEVVDWHANEVPLLHEGEHLRIDRLVRHRETGAWWVLDYKSAARPERDAELIGQLRRYRVAVQGAHPQAIVVAAFLTGQGTLVMVDDN